MAQGAAATLFTIGYQQTSLADLIALLAREGVRAVIDVRAVPWSRRRECGRKALSAALEEAGIGYLHLAGLGNPKTGRDAARAGDTARYRGIFLAHLDGETARRDLDRAAALARTAPACLLCYERDPACCHRRLVADRLAQEHGFTIRDLRPVSGN